MTASETIVLWLSGAYLADLLVAPSVQDMERVQSFWLQYYSILRNEVVQKFLCASKLINGRQPVT